MGCNDQAAALGRTSRQRVPVFRRDNCGVRGVQPGDNANIRENLTIRGADAYRYTHACGADAPTDRYAYAYRCAYTHANAYAYPNPNRCAYTHAYRCAYTHAYAYANRCAYTHTHTYPNRYAYTNPNPNPNPNRYACTYAYAACT